MKGLELLVIGGLYEGWKKTAPKIIRPMEDVVNLGGDKRQIMLAVHIGLAKREARGHKDGKWMMPQLDMIADYLIHMRDSKVAE